MGSQRTTAKKPKTKSVKKTGRKTAPKMGVLVPQPHGGAILNGMAVNHVPGPGRPPDEIRAKLRHLANGKALPFLSRILDGTITLSLLGRCDACAHEQPISEEWVELLVNRLATSDEHRIRVSEMLLRHGLASKEIVIASPDAAAFFDCISAAATELYGPEGESTLRARAVALMEARK